MFDNWRRIRVGFRGSLFNFVELSWFQGFIRIFWHQIKTVNTTMSTQINKWI